MEILLHILAGAVVGTCIGLTGVGGGSLMTPLLLLFGYPLPVAIGTDLLYASCTKIGGIWSHSRQKTVDWRLVGLLAAGSLPLSVLTIVLLATGFEQAEDYTPTLTRMLGLMLILTALVITLRQQLQNRMRSIMENQASGRLSLFTVLIGAVLGVCVTLSSIGAGAFAAAMLMLFYTRLSAVRVVGTDIAHAVPLTLIAGLGHLTIGNVDLYLLAGLLMGSLPAVTISSKLANRIPDTALRLFLATILLLLGIRFILF